MTTATFKIEEGNFNGQTGCTVSINRSSMVVSVRPKGLRKVYEMRLDDLAKYIIGKVAIAELK